MKTTFQMNALFLLFFLLISFSAAFAQKDSQEHTPQKYGEPTLIYFTVSPKGDSYDVTRGYVLEFSAIPDLREVLVFNWVEGELTLQSLSKFDTTGVYEVTLIDQVEIYFRTSRGVTSFVYNENEDHTEAAMILNGKLAQLYVQGAPLADLGGHPEDEFRNVLEWAYTFDLHEMSVTQAVSEFQFR